MVFSYELLNLLIDFLLALGHGLWYIVMKLLVSGCRFLQSFIEIVLLLVQITIRQVLHTGVEVQRFRLLRIRLSRFFSS